MNDLDQTLARLRGEPLPDALGMLDDAVMAGFVDARARLAGRSVERRTIALACTVAAVVGLWGGLAGSRSADTHREALLDVPAAAPSHLLAS